MLSYGGCVVGVGHCTTAEDRDCGDKRRNCICIMNITILMERSSFLPYSSVWRLNRHKTFS